MALGALLEVMRRLRDPRAGCPWDRQQDFRDIAPYTLEEAYEVYDAIEAGDRARLRDELGDLLFQVVFLSQIACERGAFDFADVAAAVTDKLVRRHPHVFAAESAPMPEDAEAQRANWEALKAAERAREGREGALAGIARALPALTRAAKLGQRAARVGFDWSDVGGVRAKVLEEWQELTEAASDSRQRERCGEEFGDLLFALTQYARHLGIDAEAALRAANRKFETRFAAMEQQLRESGRELDTLSPDDWDRLWNTVKGIG
ncbi:MAG: nucleoside triphosphate pyrophosphohydrolase [Steroidobacteraceae bacterium]|nr:nucleoside triphosphate pyrophosphohydrolase [Steroidobacteraceae bacterium]MDW8260699.1 nucleoside triphosphate pyrophosphohydrolase [Gammaproteobacteria bacterium]